MNEEMFYKVADIVFRIIGVLFILYAIITAVIGVFFFPSEFVSIKDGGNPFLAGLLTPIVFWAGCNLIKKDK